MEVFLSRLLDRKLVGRKRSKESSAVDRFYESNLFDRNVVNVIADMYMDRPDIITGDIMIQQHKEICGRMTIKKKAQCNYFRYRNQVLRICGSERKIAKVKFYPYQLNYVFELLDYMYEDHPAKCTCVDACDPFDYVALVDEGFVNATESYRCLTLSGLMTLDESEPTIKMQRQILYFLIALSFSDLKYFIVSTRCNGITILGPIDIEHTFPIESWSQDRHANRTGSIEYMVNGHPLDSENKVNRLLEKIGYTPTKGKRHRSFIGIALMISITAILTALIIRITYDSSIVARRCI